MATDVKAPALRGEFARQAVIAAALELFASAGFRRTSIEDLARHAGVSRPTVYAHFESKEDIFRTLVHDLHEQHLGAMEAAIERDGPLADRLYRSLVARFSGFIELASSSPFAPELLDEGSRICGDIIADARARTLRLLRLLLEDADERSELDLDRSGLSVSAAAMVIYDCAEGAKEDGTTTLTAYRRRLRQVIAALLGGLAR